MTKGELDLISEVVMYLLLEKGIRGGVTYIYKRYSRRSKHLTSYDPKIPTKYYVLEQNSLYGYVMSKLFPTGGFEGLDPAKLNLDKYDDGIRPLILELPLRS